MIKNIKLLLVMFLIAESTACLHAQEKYTISCHAEKALIDRYKHDQISTINEYNQLIGRLNNGTASKFEQKCIFEFSVPVKSSSYPYGLQWLAGFVSKCSKPLPINASNAQLQVLAQDHLHAIIGKAHDKAVFMDTAGIPENIKETVIINRNDLRRADSTKQLTEEQIVVELHNGRNKTLHRKVARTEYLQALSYYHSIQFAQQEPKKYTHADSTVQQRKRFCERYLPMIQGEARAQQITRLKKENPIDTNPLTNKFAKACDVDLFTKLFDRIA